MEKRTHFNLRYLIAALLCVLWLRDVWVNMTQVESIPYSQFQQDLREGRIKDIAIAANSVQGSHKEAKPDGRTRFVATRVDPELAKDLAQYNVEFAGAVESTFLRDVPRGASRRVTAGAWHPKLTLVKRVGRRRATMASACRGS